MVSGYAFIGIWCGLKTASERAQTYLYVAIGHILVVTPVFNFNAIGLADWPGELQRTHSDRNAILFSFPIATKRNIFVWSNCYQIGIVAVLWQQGLFACDI